MPVARTPSARVGDSQVFRAPLACVAGVASTATYLYPTTSSDRKKYRTPSGKKVTSHQWAVYDYILQIPEGKVTTYKQICLAIGQGSPRTVGSALRNNPFAPYVPCHRVIASSLFIGGFFGEWGTIRRINQPAGRPVVLDKSEFQCERKLELLRKEGVCFTSDGYLEDKLGSLWK